MILTQKHLSRRSMLRGLGTAVALPVLDAMFPALSSAAKTAKRVAPSRMVFVYVPNGIDPTVFYPDTPLEPRNPNRLRVLIEGPIVIPYKGMDDAHAAISPLDCDIWIVSSVGRPKPGRRYDRFLRAHHLARCARSTRPATSF